MQNLDLAKANRQMVAERQALLAERDKLRAVLDQRAVDTVGEFMDGLAYLIRRSRLGDKAAHTHLVDCMSRIGEAANLAKLDLPSDNGSGPC